MSACHSASACQIESKSDHLRQSYDVISIFQDGGQGIAILLPVSVFVIPLIREVEIYLHTKFWRNLNPRMRHMYYCFRFQLLHLRHHQHVTLHLTTKFRPNRTIRDRVMMAAVSHIELFQGYCRPPTKCRWSLRWVLKFRLDRIYSFRDIAIFVL